jgi:phage terminase small subunit
MKLTAKQERFCYEYIRLGKGAEAYRRAYDCRDGYAYASRAAVELMQNVNVAAMIEKLREELRQSEMNAVERLLRHHLSVLEYDPSEIAQLRRGACRHCYGENFERQWREPEYLEAVQNAEYKGEPLPSIAGGFGYDRTRDPNPDCPNCDGLGVAYEWTADTRTLSEAARAGYLGFKSKRGGLEIIFADKAKAADAIARMLGADKTNLNLTGDAGAAAAAIAAAVDPAEAARAYQKLMSGA